MVHIEALIKVLGLDYSHNIRSRLKICQDCYKVEGVAMVYGLLNRHIARGAELTLYENTGLGAVIIP